MGGGRWALTSGHCDMEGGGGAMYMPRGHAVHVSVQWPETCDMSQHVTMRLSRPPAYYGWLWHKELPWLGHNGLIVSHKHSAAPPLGPQGWRRAKSPRALTSGQRRAGGRSPGRPDTRSLFRSLTQCPLLAPNARCMGRRWRPLSAPGSTNPQVSWTVKGRGSGGRVRVKGSARTLTTLSGRLYLMTGWPVQWEVHNSP